MPSNYKIPAHQHPTHEAVTIISGELRFGMGDKLDEAKAQTLSQGGFVDLPADMNSILPSALAEQSCKSLLRVPSQSNT